jgi:hypothetical protein
MTSGNILIGSGSRQKIDAGQPAVWPRATPLFTDAVQRSIASGFGVRGRPTFQGESGGTSADDFGSALAVSASLPVTCGSVPLLKYPRPIVLSAPTTIPAASLTSPSPI